MKNILSIKNLTIGFGSSKRKIIRHGINVSGNEGELIALIGANGAGKSTLLRYLAGLSTIFEGEIILQKKTLQTYNRNQLASCIAYVSTEALKIEYITVFELVALGRYPYSKWLGILDEADKSIIKNSLEYVGMLNFAERNFNDLSDGEKQRVMIARALCQETKIILLDEPTAFLDVEHKYEIIRLLRDLAHQHKKLIIFSSHDFNIVNKFSDKIWLFLATETLESAPEDFILSGKYAELFNGNDVVFDVHTGDFKGTSKFKKKIKVEGKNRIYLWTKLALERIGYEHCMEAESTVYAEMQNQIPLWILEQKLTKHTFNNLYELLNELKKQ